MTSIGPLERKGMRKLKVLLNGGQMLRKGGIRIG